MAANEKLGGRDARRYTTYGQASDHTSISYRYLDCRDSNYLPLNHTNHSVNYPS
jgi:hypothetical protein